MLIRYYIVDDFLDNPDWVVEAATASAQGFSSNGNSAGFAKSQAALGEPQRKILQQVTQEASLSPSSDANGNVRFISGQSLPNQYIDSITNTKTKWAGVVYLSKDHPAVDGTTFWKHLSTGLEEIPKTRDGLAEHGWHTKADVKSFLETDGLDESLWEKTFTVPYKYNRLVLFRRGMFHATGPAFGDALNNSRIEQMLFLGS